MFSHLVDSVPWRDSLPLPSSTQRLPRQKSRCHLSSTAGLCGNVSHHLERCFHGKWLRGSRRPPPLRNQLLELQPLGGRWRRSAGSHGNHRSPRPFQSTGSPNPHTCWKLFPQRQRRCLDNFNDTVTETLGIFNQRSKLFLAAVFCSLFLSGLAPPCKV